MTGPHAGPDAGAGSDGCGAHPGLAAELRAVALSVLDRLEPAVGRIRDAPAGPAGTCAGCPVCALLAVLRGERPELAGRLAEQAAGLLTVLRTALEDGDPDPAPQPDPVPDPAPSGRRVQRIPIERVGT